MSFHITIKDNETGATVLDVDTKAIIGGLQNGGNSQSIIMAKCTDFELVKTVHAAEKGAEHIKNQKGPFFRFMVSEVAGAATSEVEPLSESKTEEDTEQ